MIHYHGTPMTPRSELWKMAGKHFCISFPDHRDTDICFNIGQSIMLDNGAFSLFTKGLELDLSKFYKWIEPYLGHPHWAVVPDVIDGKKEDNLALIKQWPFRKDCAAVVWHLSEPIDHLSRLIDLNFGKIAFGSSKEYWKIGSEAWKKRIEEAFNSIVKNGEIPWIHMMRGLSLGGKHYPFSSADSTNVTRHHYKYETAEYMARQIDSNQCPVKWKIKGVQEDLIQ